jgi:hypothetical protein
MTNAQWFLPVEEWLEVAAVIGGEFAASHTTQYNRHESPERQLAFDEGRGYVWVVAHVELDRWTHGYLLEARHLADDAFDTVVDHIAVMVAGRTGEVSCSPRNHPVPISLPLPELRANVAAALTWFASKIKTSVQIEWI